MAGGITQRAAAAALNYLTGKSLDLGASPQTMYVTLLTAPPPDNPRVGDINELVATGYQRQPVSWDRATGTPADIVNTTPVLFGPFLDSGGMAYPATHLVMIGAGLPESTANMLPTNVAEITTDTSGWAINGNCTIARSTAQYKVSPASLAVTTTAAGSSMVSTASRYPVTSYNTYRGSAQVMSATAGVKASVSLGWYDSNDIFLFASLGSQVTLAANTWAEASITATAPAGATKAVLRIAQDTTGASQVSYCDSMKIVPTVTSDVLMVWQLDTPGQAAQGESLQFESGALGMSLS